MNVYSAETIEALKIVAAFAMSKIAKGYIYGATGWICTISRVEQQAKQYPQYADLIRKYGLTKWLNVQCYDCAQLTKAAAKAAGFTIASGATSQWKKTAWAAKGTIDTLPEMAGVFLYRQDTQGTMQHTGIYNGDGTFIDARGHAYGVVHRKMADYNWTHWAMLAGEGSPPAAQQSLAGLDATPDNLALGTTTVNMRTSASTGTKVLRRVKLGETVHCLSDNGTWVQCEIDGLQGWIMRKFLMARG